MEIAELTRPVKSRNARILVIDDERAVRGSIRGFLEDRDYQVLEASSATTSGVTCRTSAKASYPSFA
jgi:CheY-like chemotaxis protein